MSIVSDDLPLIYGTEFLARALCAQTSLNIDPMPIRFMVGTLSLKNENKIHLLEYHDELSSSKIGLHKLVFKHPAGEIWDISCSPKNPNLFATCYSSIEKHHLKKNCAIWKLSVDLSNSYIEEEHMNNPSIQHIHDLNKNDTYSKIGFNDRISLWHPEDGDKIFTMESQNLILWDVETGEEINDINVISLQENSNILDSKINKFRWSPHSQCSLIGLAVENQVLGKDIRSNNNNSIWKIDAHSQAVKNLDFNPNAQYYLATCGEDCQYKLWDLRKITDPVFSMLNHSHWVWSIRYNLYHDQLLLTCSSDYRVILSRISSFASQPFGHLLEEDTLNEENYNEDLNELNKTNCSIDNLTESSYSQKKLSDDVVSVFLEHEDSVYAAEWSNADPWIFSSISYDGRLVINKVPKEEKYNLLI